MIKRLLGSVTALAVLTIAAVIPTAASQSPVERAVIPVTWELTSEQCPHLPDGTTVWGEGTLTDTVIAKEKDGVTSLHIVSQASGSAYDNHGNVYHFHYGDINEQQNSVASPNLFIGTMVDQFSLAGNGPANLTNGFKGTTSFDANTNAFLITSVQWMHGDPVTTPVVNSICDPL
ncbi:MAG: hypothetical protein O3C27_13020 [Actinomycetota bacterium]|nr:hypothetical protein [Actinomycetota bacterium]